MKALKNKLENMEEKKELTNDNTYLIPLIIGIIGIVIFSYIAYFKPKAEEKKQCMKDYSDFPIERVSAECFKYFK